MCSHGRFIAIPKHEMLSGMAPPVTGRYKDFTGFVRFVACTRHSGTPLKTWSKSFHTSLLLFCQNNQRGIACPKSRSFCSIEERQRCQLYVMSTVFSIPFIEKGTISLHVRESLPLQISKSCHGAIRVIYQRICSSHLSPRCYINKPSAQQSFFFQLYLSLYFEIHLLGADAFLSSSMPKQFPTPPMSETPEPCDRRE